MALVRSRVLKDLGLFAYWLAFVWLAADAGHDPGYFRRNEVVPYPIQDVVVVCLLLAALVVLLRLVLRPPAGWRTWARVTLRSVYVLLLLVLFASGLGTDFSGIDYVPFKFALATLLILGISVLAGVGTRIVRRTVA
jgi:hypothetical protein